MSRFHVFATKKTNQESGMYENGTGTLMGDHHYGLSSESIINITMTNSDMVLIKPAKAREEVGGERGFTCHYVNQLLQSFNTT